MKNFKTPLILLLLVGLMIIISCESGPESTRFLETTKLSPPTLAGNWTLIAADADGVPIENPSMWLVFEVIDVNGYGKFVMGGNATVETFNGSFSGEYSLVGTTEIIFSNDAASNTIKVIKSPFTGHRNELVLEFHTNLELHNDPNNTKHRYTFHLRWCC